MRIIIYAGNLVPFHAKSLEERALGGTETGVIRLSEEFIQLGHQVSVYTSHEKPDSTEVSYFNIQEIQSAAPVDVFISVRDWIPCFYEIQAKKRFFWSGDSYDQFPNFGVGDLRVSNQIDSFLTVSRWQAEEIAKYSGFPIEKCFVIKNGINLNFFEGAEDRKRKRLIYSSTPYRGLEHVPLLFQTLKSKHPELELHVFSGYKVYDQNEKEFEKLREALNQLEGCSVHGNVLQKELAREFMKSSILFYPCSFEETSCITAMEAMAAGCVPLTTQLGALPETIGPAGVLIEGKPSDESYIKNYLKMAHRLLSDDAFFNDLSEKGKARAQDYSWKKVAEDFSKFISTLES